MSPGDWKVTLRLNNDLVHFREWVLQYARSRIRMSRAGTYFDHRQLVLECPPEAQDQLAPDAIRARFSIRGTAVLRTAHGSDPSFDAITFELQAPSRGALLVEAHATPFPESLEFLARLVKEILRVFPDTQLEAEEFEFEPDPLWAPISPVVSEVIELAEHITGTPAELVDSSEEKAEQAALEATESEHTGGRPRLEIYDQAYEKEKAGWAFSDIYAWFKESADKDWLARLVDPKDSLKKALQHRRKQEKTGE